MMKLIRKNLFWFWLVFGTVVALGSGLVYKQRIYSIHFVDENDNFVIGKEISEGGKVYERYFSHHLPGAYLISGTIQKIAKINNPQILIKRHRESVIIWSMLWLVILSVRFRGKGLAVGLIYELIKYRYLGNLFLAESLSAYPLMYMAMVFNENKKLKKTELMFLGIIMGFLMWSLASLWPLVMVFLMAWWFKVENKKEMIYLGLGVVMITGVVAKFVDMVGFWNQAILINLKYYIPGLRDGWNWAYGIIGLGTLWLIVKGIKNKEGWWILFLGLAGIRGTRIGEVFYGGFHLIPVIVVGLAFIWTRIKVVGWVILLVVIISLGPELIGKRNINKDYHVDFSAHTDLREAVRIVSEDGDKLLMLSDETLVAWQDELEVVGGFGFYYPWMTKVPEIMEKYEKEYLGAQLVIWRESPDPWVKKMVENYKILGKRENSYVGISQEKYKGLTKEQKNELRFWRFDINNNLNWKSTIEKYITIVNPVRDRMLWANPGMELMNQQYGYIEKAGVKASWLLQYDVLSDGELVTKIRNFNEKQELGLFLEISEGLAQMAKVIYKPHRPWYKPDVVFLSGYTRNERKKMIDEMFFKFFEEFGQMPGTMGAWWIDSWSMNYIREKYGVKIAMIVADQKTTDDYGVWGQWWGAPYRASKYNVLVPGEGPVIIQWALRDPKKAVGEGPEFSNYSLQANDYLERGLSFDYFKSLANKYLTTTGQITIGLEAGTEAKIIEELGKQIEYVAKLEGVQVVTMSEFGEKFEQAEESIVDDWKMTKTSRENKEIGEKIEYKKDVVFADYFVADKSGFLDRALPLKNKNRVYFPYWLILLIIFNFQFLILNHVKRGRQFKIFNLLIINLFLWLGFGSILKSRYELGWKVFYGPVVNNLQLAQIGIVIGVMIVFWLLRKKKWLIYAPLVFGVETILKAIRYTNIEDEKIIGITKGVYKLIGLGWKNGIKLVNRKMTNVEAGSLLKLNFDYWQWLILDIVAGGILLFLINKLPKKWRFLGLGMMVILMVVKAITVWRADPVTVKPIL